MDMDVNIYNSTLFVDLIYYDIATDIYRTWVILENALYTS